MDSGMCFLATLNVYNTNLKKKIDTEDEKNNEQKDLESFGEKLIHIDHLLNKWPGSRHSEKEYCDWYTFILLDLQLHGKINLDSLEINS